MPKQEILMTEHLDNILSNLREKDIAEIDGLDIMHEALTAGASIAWALVKDGSTLAIGGVREIWKGTGEAWLIGSAELHKYPVALHRIGKAALKAAEDAGFHRIQCTVNVNNDTAMAWTEALGFHVEALLHKYETNQDKHYMYARLNNGN